MRIGQRVNGHNDIVWEVKPESDGVIVSQKIEVVGMLGRNGVHTTVGVIT